jgi:hypothetical protein
MKRLTLLFALLALLTATAATAARPAPALYRARLNDICRGHTPQFHLAQTAMAHATKANKPKTFETALRRYLLIGLRQNHQLESIKVPGKLWPQMAPIFKRMKKVDPHLHAAIAHSRAGDVKGTRFQLKVVAKLSQPLPGQLDAVGLLDCGSNQQPQ